MKYTAIVIAGFVGVLVVFSRRYLSPYDSAAGQLVLLFVGGYWAAGFWWMQRMGRAEPVDRFLAKTDEFTNPDGDDRAASSGRGDEELRRVEPIRIVGRPDASARQWRKQLGSLRLPGQRRDA